MKRLQSACFEVGFSTNLIVKYLDYTVIHCTLNRFSTSTISHSINSPLSSDKHLISCTNYLYKCRKPITLTNGKRKSNHIDSTINAHSIQSINSISANNTIHKFSPPLHLITTFAHLSYCTIALDQSHSQSQWNFQFPFHVMLICMDKIKQWARNNRNQTIGSWQKKSHQPHTLSIQLIIAHVLGQPHQAQ
jgi:hypothetical protein